MRLMDQDETTGPINLGNPGEFTMLELAQNVLKLTGSKSTLTARAAAGRRPQAALPRHHQSQNLLELVAAKCRSKRG